HPAPRRHLVRTVRDVQPAAEIALHEERLGPGRLENPGDAPVDPGDGRTHCDHHGHADRDAEHREPRPDLVGPDGVQRDHHSLGHAAPQRGRPGRGHSALSATMGSSRDARLAGYTPAAMPTPMPSPIPTTTDQGATAAGRGVSALTTKASVSPNPMPSSAPAADSVADSTTNWARMSRRRAPSAFRMPISRVRSLTAINMMFMITIPPTTREIATRPGRATNSTREIFCQLPSAPSAV